MKVKEFEALTLKDCLQQVRQDLGPEAVILETQKFRKGGILGWRARDAVRVIAATGIAVTEPYVRDRQNGSASEGRSGERKHGGTKAAVGTTTGERAHTATEPSEGPYRTSETSANDHIARLERDMIDLKSGFESVREAVLNSSARQSVISHAVVPAQSFGQASGMGAMGAVALYPEILARLREAEVSEDVAHELLESLPDLNGWSLPARLPMAESALRDLMADRITSAGPIRMTPNKPKMVALIGPTGVGKTTTIAKLAAHFALVEKRKVGLLTMDTYRIAAVEQLKTYSQIIDIPVRVAYNPSDIAPAIKSFDGCDLILIDTAGRSQKNIMQVTELKALLDTTSCETHLVLSASTKERDLLDQVKRFSGLRVDRLLFTKLDETTTYGTMFTVAAKCGIPVSYITTGQKVPEDIEIADGNRVALLVMNSGTAQ